MHEKEYIASSRYFGKRPLAEIAKCYWQNAEIGKKK